jgi:hypothetical protein
MKLKVIRRSDEGGRDKRRSHYSLCKWCLLSIVQTTYWKIISALIMITLLRLLNNPTLDKLDIMYQQTETSFRNIISLLSSVDLL